MNENGAVNIFLIILSYIFSPNTQIDEEIMIDEEGNITIAPPQTKGQLESASGNRNNSDEILKTMEVTMDEDEEEEKEAGDSGGVEMREP